MAPDVAEDVASQTWIRVIGSLPQFHGDGEGFRGWMITIARHLLADEHRRSSRRREILMADGGHLRMVRCGSGYLPPVGLNDLYFACFAAGVCENPIDHGLLVGPVVELGACADVSAEAE
jgi:hypothetical protein